MIIEIINFLCEKNVHPIIIIDQYKRASDTKENNLNTLLERVFITKTKIIIASSVNDNEIKHHLCNNWVGDNILESKHYHYFPELINLETEVKKENEEFQETFRVFGFLPKFYYQIKKAKNYYYSNFEDTQREHIIRKLKEMYNKDEKKLISALIIISDHVNVELNKKEFSFILKDLPLKYFRVYQNNGTFTIQYHFPFLQKVIKELVNKEYYLLLRNSALIEKELDRNPSIKGTLFENILHLNFQNNCSPFKNITITDVVRINEFKSFKLRTTIKLKNNQTIFLWPINSNAPYFDSGLLIEKDGVYTLILFQITINKEENKMMTRVILEERYRTILSKMQEKLKITILEQNCFFFYIFCKETVEDFDIRFCKKEKIQCLLCSKFNLSFYEFKEGLFGNTVIENLPLEQKNRLFTHQVKKQKYISLGKKTNRKK